MENDWVLVDVASAQGFSAGADDSQKKKGGEQALIPSIYLLPPQLRRPSIARNAASLAPIPAVDLRNPLAVRQMHSACKQWGAFFLLNHGIPHQLLHLLRSQIMQFLDLPVAVRCPRFLDRTGEGYGPGFLGPTTGIADWRDCLRLYTFPISCRSYDSWPTDPVFRGALEGFADETYKLQQDMLRRFALNLGLGPARLQEAMGEIQQKILMNHYPPCPQPEAAAGTEEHTDLGAVTCLWQLDDVIGLEVYHNDLWLSISPPPDSVLIIVGDQVEKASNGLYKSPRHRAVLNSAKRRIVMISFFNLRPEQTVGPLEELVDDEHPPLFEATTFRDNVASTFRLQATSSLLRLP